MSEYLTKEEIKQWRSSLEKITLEEFAHRLGKKVESKKETNDLIDIVLHGKPVVSSDFDRSSVRIERLSAIADRAYEKEKDIYITAFSAKNLTSNVSTKKDKCIAKTITTKVDKSIGSVSKSQSQKAHKEIIDSLVNNNREEDVRIVFKKALTEREQKVFDYFVSHKNNIVYAKDLASLLCLPRDYIYKYIKTLRSKIDGDNLKNADKGGFVLSL